MGGLGTRLLSCHVILKPGLGIRHVVWRHDRFRNNIVLIKRGRGLGRQLSRVESKWWNSSEQHNVDGGSLHQAVCEVYCVSVALQLPINLHQPVRNTDL